MVRWVDWRRALVTTLVLVALAVLLGETMYYYLVRQSDSLPHCGRGSTTFGTPTAPLSIIPHSVCLWTPTLIPVINAPSS